MSPIEYIVIGAACALAAIMAAVPWASFRKLPPDHPHKRRHP